MKRSSLTFCASVLMLSLAACSSSSSGDSPPDNTNSAEAGGGGNGDADSGPPRCATPPCAEGSGCTGNADCNSGVCRENKCLPASAADGVKNGTETDADCGGNATDAPRCDTDKACTTATDCKSNVCKSGKCVAATSSDGVKNGDESDKDCGGTSTHAPACADGKACNGTADCESSVCKSNVCQVPTHTDGAKNGDETGKDCGGPTSGKKCADGDGCETAEGARDCTSLVCEADKCKPASHTDGVKNGDETGKDCGGPTANPCADGEGCDDAHGARDCTSFVCANSVCQVPTHTDNVKNGDETGKDCGGPTSNIKCAAGEGCDNAQATRDCSSFVCANSLCQAPTFTDGVKNGDETGKDCGGPTSNIKCADGEGCDNAQGARDCSSFVCASNLCQAPKDTDGVKNGTETDTDCGGAVTNKRCTAAKACLADADCNSSACYNNKCTWGRSCKMHNGGDTCGTGDETFTAAASEAGASWKTGTKFHHDCCESAVVNPDGVAGNGDDYRLDLYQVTAGRMRTFINAVGGNVRQWVKDARAGANGASFKDPGAAAQLPLANDDFLPRGVMTNETVVNTDGQSPVSPAPVNVVAHLGGYRFNTEPGGQYGYGCNLQPGGYGSRTWRLEDDQLSFYGETQHLVSQERLDQKALVCVDYYMLAAFCAWDGGRLETKTEHATAWGTAHFPWGSTGTVQGFVEAANGVRWGGNKDNPAAADLIYNATPTSPGNFVVANLDHANAAWNYANYFIFDFRRYLEGRFVDRDFFGETSNANGPIDFFSAANNGRDQSYAVAPPGRYPANAGPWGHRDLIGNAMEITAQKSGSNYMWSKNGSFEGFTHWSGDVGYDAYAFSGLTKYGRATGRCARPLAQP